MGCIGGSHVAEADTAKSQSRRKSPESSESSVSERAAQLDAAYSCGRGAAPQNADALQRGAQRLRTRMYSSGVGRA